MSNLSVTQVLLILVLVVILVGVIDGLVPQDLYVADNVHRIITDLTAFAAALKP